MGKTTKVKNSPAGNGLDDAAVVAGTSGAMMRWHHRQILRIAKDLPLRGTREDLDRVEAHRITMLADIDNWLEARNRPASNGQPDDTASSNTAIRLLVGGHGRRPYDCWRDADWWLKRDITDPSVLWEMASQQVLAGATVRLGPIGASPRTPISKRRSRRAPALARLLPREAGADSLVIDGTDVMTPNRGDETAMSDPVHPTAEAATVSDDDTNPGDAAAILPSLHDLEERDAEITRLTVMLDEERDANTNGHAQIENLENEVTQLRRNFHLVTAAPFDPLDNATPTDLTDQASALAQAVGITKALPDAPTLLAVVDAAVAQYDQLVVLPSARRSAGRSPFKLTNQVADAFAALAELADVRRQGPIGQTVEQWMREHGVNYAEHETGPTLERWSEERTFTYKDRSYLMQSHIRIGNSTDPRVALRMHLAWQDDDQVWLIGHIGHHLTSRMSLSH